LHERLTGVTLAAAAAALWAIGGIAAQELFSHHGIDPAWPACGASAGRGASGPADGLNRPF